MKIGIISDTHDNFKITKQACRLFKDRNIDILVHAGDFTSPEVLALFKDFNCRFVMGNADRDFDQLNAECLKIGFDCIREICELTIDDKKILILHGNVVPVFREAIASGKYNYIIKGHTHHFEDYIRNNTRVINPGGLEQEHSVAILDTENDHLERIILKPDPESE